jgi:hypothetical protein
MEDHRAYLLEKLQIGYVPSEEELERVWKKTDYANFFVCSFMKTTDSSVMISYGFLKKVKLANDKWVEETRDEILRRSNY